MAELEPKKFNLSDINNGQKYENGDGIQANAINAPLEAAAYILGLGENPDISEIDGTGEPSVSIGTQIDSSGWNTAQLVFKNLQGRSFYILNTSSGPSIIGSTVNNYETNFNYDLTATSPIINAVPKVGENILGFALLYRSSTSSVDINNPTRYLCTYKVTSVVPNAVNGAPSKTSGTVYAKIIASCRIDNDAPLSLLRPFINFEYSSWQENQTVSISRNLFNRNPKIDEAVFAFVELANQTDILFVLFRVTQVDTSNVTLQSAYSISIKGNKGEKGDASITYLSTVSGEAPYVGYSISNFFISNFDNGTPSISSKFYVPMYQGYSSSDESALYSLICECTEIGADTITASVVDFFQTSSNIEEDVTMVYTITPFDWMDSSTANSAIQERSKYYYLIQENNHNKGADPKIIVRQKIVSDDLFYWEEIIPSLVLDNEGNINVLSNDNAIELKVLVN